MIPYAIMMITNCMFAYRMNVNKKRVNKNEKLTISLQILIVNNFFIILTAPKTISSAFFLNDLLKTEEGLTLLFYFDSILFSFHGLNFFALILTNKQFSKEAKALINSFMCYQKIRPSS